MFFNKGNGGNNHFAILVDRFFKLGFVLNKQYRKTTTNVVSGGVTHLPAAFCIQRDIYLWTTIFIEAGPSIRNILTGDNRFILYTGLWTLATGITKFESLTRFSQRL